MQWHLVRGNYFVGGDFLGDIFWGYIDFQVTNANVVMLNCLCPSGPTGP